MMLKEDKTLAVAARRQGSINMVQACDDSNVHFRGYCSGLQPGSAVMNDMEGFSQRRAGLW